MISNSSAADNPAMIARYISVDIFGRMLTYGTVVAGGLGFWRYEMIKRERAARIAAENRAIAIQQQAADERRQAAAERERLMATVTGLVEQVSLLVQQRNGNHGGNDHSPNAQ